MKYVAIITGPVEYLPGGPTTEVINITKQDIKSSKSEGEKDIDVIKYIINDYQDEWSQRFCSAIVLPLKEYQSLPKHK